MKHVVPHSLDQATARKAADGAFQAYSEKYAKYDPRVTWTSDEHANVAFRVKGMHLGGTIDLEPGRIALDLEVPLLLRVFKKQAIEVIEREIRVWIDKAKAGAL